MNTSPTNEPTEEVPASVKAAVAYLSVATAPQADDSAAESAGQDLVTAICRTLMDRQSQIQSEGIRRGITRKLQAGGTPGLAPLGYLNTVVNVEGRTIRTVTVDEEPAGHIRWAFTAYASGQWNLASLREELKRRGLRTRPTRGRAGAALSLAQIRRMLGHSYYIGKVQHGGEVFDGSHEALVDEATWERVQERLANASRHRAGASTANARASDGERP